MQPGSWDLLEAVRLPGLAWDWHRSGRGGASLMSVLFFSLAPEAPPALETLRVEQRGEHSLRLHWQPVPGARGFRLRWRPEGERYPRWGGGGVRDQWGRGLEWGP